MASWSLYRALAPRTDEDVPAATKAKAAKALTEAELECDAFETEEAARLAMVRSLAQTSQDPRAYALLARAALWLAREALLREPPPPWDAEIGKLESLLDAANGTRDDLAEFFGKCVACAAKGPHAAVALTLYARAAIAQVDDDDAEAWLVKAEAALVHVECKAAQGAGTEVAPPPADRSAMAMFWDAGFAEDDLPEELREGLRGWARSVPGHHSQRLVLGPADETRGRIYLADYWYNMPEDRAWHLVGMFRAVETCLTQFRRACVDPATRDRLVTRALTVERDLQQRGPALIDSYAGTTPPTPEKARRLDGLRHVYAGSHFEPTVAFVKSLEVLEPRSVWSISCMLTGERTVLSLMDTTPNGRWSPKIFPPPDFLHPGERRAPTARECFDAVLHAAAGTAPPDRYTAGPPRRPSLLVVSYRLRSTVHSDRPSLPELLEEIDVPCQLETAESLQFACANNHTDFDTGAPRDPTASFVGTVVAIEGLRSDKGRPHNGRVGRVRRWITTSGRWEVELLALPPHDTTTRIAVRPENLVPAQL